MKKKLKEPETFEKVVENFHWMKAIEEEIAILKQNQTWYLVPKPKYVKQISCKLIYKVKKCPGGSVERYKARLVAREFSR